MSLAEVLRLARLHGFTLMKQEFVDTAYIGGWVVPLFLESSGVFLYCRPSKRCMTDSAHVTC